MFVHTYLSIRKHHWFRTRVSSLKIIAWQWIIIVKQVSKFLYSTVKFKGITQLWECFQRILPSNLSYGFRVHVSEVTNVVTGHLNIGRLISNLKKKLFKLINFKLEIPVHVNIYLNNFVFKVWLQDIFC